MLESIELDPVVPLVIGLNQAGMQAGAPIGERAKRAVLHLWRVAMKACVGSSRDASELFDVSKEIANRLTEPFQHIDVIVTATDFENFFALRCHPSAEPHIRYLAWLMADAYYESTPVLRQMGEWHLPYILPQERAEMGLQTLKICSSARCARVSYKLHDGGEPSVAKDAALYARLMAGLSHGNGEPGHLSPMEHVATPLDTARPCGNLVGWLQHRKEIQGEKMSFDYTAAKERGWRDLAVKSVEGLSDG